MSEVSEVLLLGFPLEEGGVEVGVVDGEVLVEEVDNFLYLQLEDGLELGAGPGLPDHVADEFGVDGLDGQLVAGRHVDFSEVSREPAGELLLVVVGAVGDDDVLGQGRDFLALVAEAPLVLGGEAHELIDLFVSQVDVVDVDDQFVVVVLVLLFDVDLLLDEGSNDAGRRLRVDSDLDHVGEVVLGPEYLLD